MRYLKKSHKFGIELHKTLEQALALDAKNGNTLWADAKSKEMENVRVAFEVLLDRKSVPIGHHFVWCHMVFMLHVANKFITMIRLCNYNELIIVVCIHLSITQNGHQCVCVIFSHQSLLFHWHGSICELTQHRMVCPSPNVWVRLFRDSSTPLQLLWVLTLQFWLLVWPCWFSHCHLCFLVCSWIFWQL